MDDNDKIRSRSWCFTINNYTTDDVNALISLEQDVEYIIYGKEIAPTTGTPHLQGYMYWREAKTRKSLSKKLSRACLLPAKGNAQQNKTYCSKGEDVHEYGTMPSQGKRNDFENVKQQISEGKGMREIVQTATSYQSIRSAELLLKYTEQKRNWKPNVVWVHGDSGTGKTRMVYDLYPDLFRKTNSTGKWWDGYDAHPVVLIDDIKETSREYYSMLLELLDRYDVTVETKGGSRQFVPKIIYCTSIWHPHALFSKFLDAKEILRRIDEIIQL